LLRAEFRKTGKFLNNPNVVSASEVAPQLFYSVTLNLTKERLDLDAQKAHMNLNDLYIPHLCFLGIGFESGSVIKKKPITEDTAKTGPTHKKRVNNILMSRI
jgi:hypothetical protein